jgi:hypothetical protein
MRRYIVALPIAVLAMGFMAATVVRPAAAQQRPPQTTTQENPESARAQALLTRMMEHLAKAQAFSVDMQASYDVVQSSGQKIEFGETRQILVNRPDGLRMSIDRSDGQLQDIIFDGKELVFYDRDQNVFAKLAMSGTVDQVIAHLVYDLDTPIPLSLLLVTMLPQELEKRITELAVVEDTTIAGKKVTHLAARTADVDLQFWMTTEEQPVLLRAVITYKNDRGQPQFRANLSDWNFSPKIDAGSFAFAPPAGVEEVAFMVPTSVPKTNPAARK